MRGEEGMERQERGRAGEKGIDRRGAGRRRRRREPDLRERGVTKLPAYCLGMWYPVRAYTTQPAGAQNPRLPYNERENQATNTSVTPKAPKLPTTTPKQPATKAKQDGESPTCTPAPTGPGAILAWRRRRRRGPSPCRAIIPRFLRLCTRRELH